MRNIKFLIVFGLVIISSCENEEYNNIKPDSIIGTWKLSEITFNQTNGIEINDWISTNTTLNFEKNKSFYQNYVSGEWVLSDQTLLLNVGQNSLQLYREYSVLEVNENILKIQITLTDEQFCCDIEQFEPDELLTITESYIKVE